MNFELPSIIKLKMAYLIYIISLVLSFAVLFSTGCFPNRVNEQLLLDLQKDIIVLHKYNLETNRKIEELQKNISTLESTLEKKTQPKKISEKTVPLKAVSETTPSKSKKLRKSEKTIVRPNVINKVHEDKLKRKKEPILTPEKLYQKARSEFLSGKYDPAILNFTKFAKEFPGHDYADNAIYWRGEIYYVKNDFRQAIIEFKRVIKQYPKSNKVPDALLMIGLSYVQLKDAKNAAEYLQKVLDKFPFSTSARKADAKIRELEK